MLLKRIREHKSYFTLNMMPIIDIVMLLIIFFVFVCRYIAAENFAIRVPDEATNALAETDETAKFITVSVWFDEFDIRYFCAVGAEVFDITGGVDITEITAAINASAVRAGDEAVVNIRMDKDMVFRQYSDIITAISNSTAEDLHIAAFDRIKD